MAQNILITGGTGYIGSHIARLLLSQGHKMVIVDDISTGSQVSLPSIVKLIKADICSDAWQDELNDFEFSAVIHLAALTSAPASMREPERYHQVNVEGSNKVWEFCRDKNISRVLYASTAAVYGDLGITSASENSPTHPLSPYGETKLAGETSMFEICDKLSCYSLRLFNVGGGQDHRNLGEPTVLHALDKSLSNNSTFNIYGNDHNTVDGTPVRDFVHVQDVAQAFVLFATTTVTLPTGIYNIGSGVGTSIKELATLAGQTNIKIIDRRAGDISYSVANIIKATNIGWHPQKSLLEIIT